MLIDTVGVLSTPGSVQADVLGREVPHVAVAGNHHLSHFHVGVAHNDALQVTNQIVVEIDTVRGCGEELPRDADPLRGPRGELGNCREDILWRLGLPGRLPGPQPWPRPVPSRATHHRVASRD